jgi:hypothetical protein
VINIGNQSIAVGDNYKDPFLEFMSGWMSWGLGKKRLEIGDFILCKIEFLFSQEY